MGLLDFAVKDKEGNYVDLGFGLPTLVIDEDFTEYLEELCIESMDVAEFFEVWQEWAKDNLE